MALIKERDGNSRILQQEEEVIFVHNGTTIEGKVFEYKEDKKIYSCRIAGGHLVSVPHAVCFPKTEVAEFLNSCLIQIEHKETGPGRDETTIKVSAPPEESKDAQIDEKRRFLDVLDVPNFGYYAFAGCMVVIMMMAIGFGIMENVSETGTVSVSGSGETVEMQAAKRVNERNIRLMSPSPLPLERACEERGRLLEENRKDVSLMFPNR